MPFHPYTYFLQVICFWHSYTQANTNFTILSETLVTTIVHQMILLGTMPEAFSRSTQDI